MQYVYLMILLTQEEEHNQLFFQLSLEFLVPSIHFLHFIHPYMNSLPEQKVLNDFPKNLTNLLLFIKNSSPTFLLYQPQTVKNFYEGGRVLKISNNIQNNADAIIVYVAKQ